MTDPITLGAIGAIALTEGVKFLYTQAGALIESWRKRRDAKTSAMAGPADDEEPQLAPLAQSAELDGQIDSARGADSALLTQRVGELEEAFEALAPYNGPTAKPVDGDDPAFLAQVERLRELLETVYGQRLTFKGESRESTGMRYDVNVRAKSLSKSPISVIENAPVDPGGDVRVKLDVDDADDSPITGISYRK